MREVIETGKTVEIAVENALKQLGLTREDVTVEVMELPVKRLLGSKPAKVKLTVVTQEKAETKPEKASEKAEEKPAKAVQAQAAAEQPAQEIANGEKAQLAVEFLSSVSEKMGVTDVKVTAVKQGESTVLKVDGKNVGSLIGRRGETMDALSYLTGLVANRNGGDYEKISLDVGGYRSKREQDLSELAKRIGEKVAKYGKSHVLEPMNPYERRIIHATISEMENVKSESTGEGTERRVVIICTGDNAQEGYTSSSYRGERYSRSNDRYSSRSSSSNNRSFNKGDRSNHGSSRPQGQGGYNREKRFDKKFDKPKAPPVVSTRTETINDAVDIGLYGKIEL